MGPGENSLGPIFFRLSIVHVWREFIAMGQRAPYSIGRS